MFQPGDVVQFHSQDAGKRKYHLCIALSGRFLFINSPKAKAFVGDFVVPCSDIPCLNPTPQGESIISCSLVMRKTDGQLQALRATKIGAVSRDLLLRLVNFIEHTPVLSAEDRDAILDGLGDWL